MADYVTLLGAEQVSNAGHNMQGAAETMTRAANQIWESNERLIRALEDHALRIELATAAQKEKGDG